MTAIATLPDSQRYARCIEASKRVRWDVERDVIRGRGFNTAHKFRSDGLFRARVKLTLLRTLMVTIVIAVVTVHGAWAQEPQHSHEVGSVTFPVSCNANAQMRMHQAVAALHSFWFPEARKLFESVVQVDPGCGIAYWGVAMSHFGNPMAGGSLADGQAAGWDAALKAQSIGGRSERDRAYIAAAVALFQDHASLSNRARMLKYETSMKQIVDRFPDDTEAQIFHAIFRVANAPPTDLTFSHQKEAAQVLTRLYRQQPRHPGLAHYIIHAFDSPSLAALALDPPGNMPASRQRHRTRCICPRTSSRVWATGTSRSGRTAARQTWSPLRAESHIHWTTWCTPICSRGAMMPPWRHSTRSAAA